MEHLDLLFGMFIVFAVLLLTFFYLFLKNKHDTKTNNNIICKYCGKKLPIESKFCSDCHKATNFYNK